jgi:hypothetical protein
MAKEVGKELGRDSVLQRTLPQESPPKASKNRETGSNLILFHDLDAGTQREELIQLRQVFVP